MPEEIKIDKGFIERELPTAPPLYVSVYLMTLAAAGESAAEIAKRLNATETDVLRAWLYWKERGFLGGKENAPRQKPLPAARPDYSPQELVQYAKHPEVQRLFGTAQQKLGRMLSQQDMSMLFSLYDWLGLPIDVIELLVSYCTANGHRGTRYIEKVALNWAEEGIDTVEKAAASIELRKTGFRAVLQAFGQGNRLPVPAEEAYMKKWLQTYALPTDVVRLACERTVLQTGKPSFAYADRILESWRKAGVKTLADVEAQDAAFAAKKSREAPAEKPAAKPAPRKNRFINYTQSEWDFAELERLEREQREKW